MSLQSSFHLCLSIASLYFFFFSVVFPWYVSIVSPLFCYRFSVLFLMFQGLSIVSLTLCRTSLLLFVVNQSCVTCYRFSLVLFSILSGYHFFCPLFCHYPPDRMVFHRVRGSIMSVLCLSSMIIFFDGSAYRKILTHRKMSEN